MRHLMLYLFAFFLLSCRSTQYSINNRLYSENSVDIKPAYPGGKAEINKFIKKNLSWPTEYGNSGYVVLAVISKKGNVTICTGELTAYTALPISTPSPAT